MRYIHRICLRATHAQIAELRELGMTFEPDDEVYLEPDPLVAFKVAEDHSHWPRIQAQMREWDTATHIVHTEFTQRELDAARWLRMTAWDNGYVLPQEDMKFVDVTYDMTHGCRRCGFGKIQKAPIRIKGEPKWGRRGIMSLIWAYDDFFVPPAVWEAIFKPFGIACRPVANRHGKLLETVVQLVFAERVDVVTDGMRINEICEECKTPKYRGVERGPFAPLVQEPSGAIARTRQAFGSGWTTYDVIISQELRRAMVAHKLRGAEFVPVKSHLDAFDA